MVMSMVWVSFLVTLPPSLSFIPMNGIRKSRPPPTVSPAIASRTSWTEATCRSRPREVRDIPALLTEALTASIRLFRGTPSSVISMVTFPFFVRSA